MITSRIHCPHCGKAETVIKQGKTDSGTPKAKYKDCQTEDRWFPRDFGC